MPPRHRSTHRSAYIMINIEAFAYSFFPGKADNFRRLLAGLLGFTLLLCGTALGQRPGLEPQRPGTEQPPTSSRPGSPRIGINTNNQPSSSLRPGLVVERSQRLGIQQVGEATAEATRQLAAKPIVI